MDSSFLCKIYSFIEIGQSTTGKDSDFNFRQQSNKIKLTKAISFVNAIDLFDELGSVDEKNEVQIQGRVSRNLYSEGGGARITI